MYVAAKGGERAIDAAHAYLAEERRGDPSVPEIAPAQIREQLKLAVDRVMAEGALYDRDLAAIAVKQARGDMIEAIFLVRAYRTTLPRFGHAEPVDTEAMVVRRRISATFKDLPGGQILGPTFDYTHRLIDFELAETGAEPTAEGDEAETAAGDAVNDTAHVETADRETAERLVRALTHLDSQGLIEREAPARDATGNEREPDDLTRQPLTFPAERGLRLQALSRGDEGYLLGLGYSTQRGYGSTHPFAGEIRQGTVAVEYAPPELGFPIEIGEIDLTECQMINQFAGSKEAPPQFTQGYGLVFGVAERKAMSMALIDRALRARELGETASAPAQDEEFVLAHSDNVQSTGFVEHLKLPHYVDFQSELELVRRMHAERSFGGQAEPFDERPGSQAEAAE